MNKFDKDYFENGIITSKSCYENYRWIPELTYPLAHSIIRHLGLKTGDQILEFGCAHGFLVKALNDLYIKAYGVDISSYAISNCPRDIINNVKLIEQNFNLFDIKNYFNISKFDYCISKDVLEHIPIDELERTILKLSQLSNYLFVVVPLGDNGKYRINTYHNDPTHVIAENEDWWIKLFEKFGGYSLKNFSYDIMGIKDRWKQVNLTGNGFFILEKK